MVCCEETIAASEIANRNPLETDRATGLDMICFAWEYADRG